MTMLHLAHQSDRLLVRKLLDGDEAAYEQFFAAMYPALYRFALARLHRREDAAEEVAQATLCRAVGKLHTYRAEASLLTWLCTFCRHEISAHVQRTGHTTVVSIDDDAEVRAAIESLRASESGSPDFALNREDVAHLVQRVLDHLPAHYGNALEWKYIDDVSVREIAHRLDLGLEAAESLLARARRAFREVLQTAVADGPVPLTVHRLSEEPLPWMNIRIQTCNRVAQTATSSSRA